MPGRLDDRLQTLTEPWGRGPTWRPAKHLLARDLRFVVIGSGGGLVLAGGGNRGGAFGGAAGGAWMAVDVAGTGPTHRAGFTVLLAVAAARPCAGAAALAVRRHAVAAIGGRWSPPPASPECWC